MTGNPPPALNLAYPPLPEAIASSLRPVSPTTELPDSMRNAAVDKNTDGGILIGLRCGLATNGEGESITSIQAVFLTTKGVIFGNVRGQPSADKWVDLIAKPGYMVGQVYLSNVPYLEGLRLQFVPLSDGRKFVTDTALSDIVGKLSKPKASAGAMPAVGIATTTTGRQMLDVGILRIDPPDPKPISAMPAPPVTQTPLPASFAQLVKDAVAKKTYAHSYIGTNSGSEQNLDFEDFAPDGGLLIGFRYGWNKSRPPAIGSIQPIFLTAAGETLGQIHGDKTIAPTNVIKAPPGYAVGGMWRNAYNPLPSLQLIYMKIGDRILSVDNAFLSARIGTASGAPEVLYQGDGTPVIGLCGLSGGQTITPGLTYLSPTASSVPTIKRPETRPPDLAGAGTPAIRTTPGRSPLPGVPNLNLNYAPLPIKLANEVSLALVKNQYVAGKMLVAPTPQNPAEQDVAQDGGVLIGLRCGMGTFANKSVPVYIQPVFLTTHGVVVGPGRGSQSNAPLIDLVAREGYAVGGATISARPYVDGLRLRFVRLADGRLNPADGYDSPTIGQVGDAPAAVGSMMPVIGIVSRWTGAVMHLGLLTMTPDLKASPALPARGAAVVPLTPAFATLANDAVTHKTYASGKYLDNGQKPDFEDFAPDGGLLVGLRYGRKALPAGFPVVVSVQPIFWTAKGQVLGQVHGDATIAPTDDIKAPAGYAVAGGTYGGGTFMEYLELAYMKIGDRVLLSNDACKSERVGALKAGNIDVSTTFNGDGTPVIGLGGTYQTNRLKLGLIYLAPTDAATVTDKTAAPGAAGAPAANGMAGGGKLVILKAVYGRQPDGPFLDVTAKVAAACKGDTLNIAVSNASLGNDPDPGNHKDLWVDYTFNGAETTKTVSEDGVFTISANGE